MSPYLGGGTGIQGGQAQLFLVGSSSWGSSVVVCWYCLVLLGLKQLLMCLRCWLLQWLLVLRIRLRPLLLVVQLLLLMLR